MDLWADHGGHGGNRHHRRDSVDWRGGWENRAIHVCGLRPHGKLYSRSKRCGKSQPRFKASSPAHSRLEPCTVEFSEFWSLALHELFFPTKPAQGRRRLLTRLQKTEEPVSEGIVALLEPFIDTVVVCTMTALVVIITGVYDNPDHVGLVADNKGAALTAVAFRTGGHEWFRWILYTAVVLFAYSTLISWSYYGERCFTRLFGDRSSLVYKLIFLVFVFLGSVVKENKILAFSDLLILGMAFPNVLGLFLLSGKVKRALDDYWEKYRSGKLDPVGKGRRLAVSRKELVDDTMEFGRRTHVWRRACGSAGRRVCLERSSKRISASAACLSRRRSAGPPSRSDATCSRVALTSTDPAAAVRPAARPESVETARGGLRMRERSLRRRHRSARTPRRPFSGNPGPRCRSVESVFRCGLIAAICSQSAWPLKKSCAVRP